MFAFSKYVGIYSAKEAKEITEKMKEDVHSTKPTTHGGPRKNAGRPKKNTVRFWGAIEKPVAEAVIKKHGTYIAALKASVGLKAAP